MPNGDDVILEALSMKLSDQKDGSSTLGFDRLQIGLKAATRGSKESTMIPLGNGLRHGMCCWCHIASRRQRGGEVRVVKYDLAVVDEQYGCIHSFEDTIKMTAASMPEAFLSYFLKGQKNSNNDVFILSIMMM